MSDTKHTHLQNAVRKARCAGAILFTLLVVVGANVLAQGDYYVIMATSTVMHGDTTIHGYHYMGVKDSADFPVTVTNVKYIIDDGRLLPQGITVDEMYGCLWQRDANGHLMNVKTKRFLFARPGRSSDGSAEFSTKENASEATVFDYIQSGNTPYSSIPTSWGNINYNVYYYDRAIHGNGDSSFLYGAPTWHFRTTKNLSYYHIAATYSLAFESHEAGLSKPILSGNDVLTDADKQVVMHFTPSMFLPKNESFVYKSLSGVGGTLHIIYDNDGTTILEKILVEPAPVVAPGEIQYEVICELVSSTESADQYVTVESIDAATGTFILKRTDKPLPKNVMGLRMKVKATIDDGSQYSATSSEFIMRLLSYGEVKIGGSVYGGGRIADVHGSTDIDINNCYSITAIYGGNDIAGSVLGNTSDAHVFKGSNITIGNNGNRNPDSVTVANMHIGSVYGGGNGFYRYNELANKTDFNTHNGDSLTFRLSAPEALYIMDGTTILEETLDARTDDKYYIVPTIHNTSIALQTDFVYVDTLFGGAKNAYILDKGNNGIITPKTETKDGLLDTVGYNYPTSIAKTDLPTSISIQVDGSTVDCLFGGNNYGGSIGQHSRIDIVIENTKVESVWTEDRKQYTEKGIGTGSYGWNSEKTQALSTRSRERTRPDVSSNWPNWEDNWTPNTEIQNIISTTTPDQTTAGAPTTVTFTSSDGLTQTQKETTMLSLTTNRYAGDHGIKYLYGGGNKVKAPLVNIAVHGGQIDTLFAGGNSAAVEATTVLVDVRDNLIYGTETYAAEENGNLQGSYKQKYYAALASDSAQYCYNIRTLFGGNNAAEMAVLPMLVLKRGGIGTVYGGGNSGDMTNRYGFKKLNEGYGGGRFSCGIYEERDDRYEFVPRKHAADNDNDTIVSTYIELVSDDIFVDIVYAGCQKSSTLHDSYLWMSGGHAGFLYGGCNISGDIGSFVELENSVQGEFGGQGTTTGSTHVYINGGYVHKASFGGANGFYHCNNITQYVKGHNYGQNNENYVGELIPTANRVSTIVNGGTIFGHIYGGGRLANVGFCKANENVQYNFNNINKGINKGKTTSYNKGHANVTIHGGTIYGNVYGGGDMASVFGTAQVLVKESQQTKPVIKGAVYGGNDKAGVINSFREINWSAKASDGKHDLNYANASSYVRVEGSPEINRVFGGGNGSYDYTALALCPDATQAVTGSDNKPVQSSSFVDIHTSGGFINYVFGGGDGVTVSDSVTVFINCTQDSLSLPRHSNDNLSYAQIGYIFGGNNSADMNAVPNIIFNKGTAVAVYGGGNFGGMTGSAPRGDLINVSTYVYLGSKQAHVSGAIFGGCRDADVSNGTYIQMDDGTAPYIFGGNDISGNVNGVSSVQIDGGTVLNPVFGGGNGYYTYVPYVSNGKIIVNDAGDTLFNVYVYGDAHGTMVATGVPGRPTSDSTSVVITGGTLNDRIYGGGWAGNCFSTSVNIDGNAIINNEIFGGGCGDLAHLGYCTNIDTNSDGIDDYIHVGNVGNFSAAANQHAGGTHVMLRNLNPKSKVERVYGGGRSGDVTASNLQLFNTCQYKFKWLYGGCMAADVTKSANMDLHGNVALERCVDTVYGGNDFGGDVERSVVNVFSGKYGSLFGGGNGNYDYKAIFEKAGSVTTTKGTQLIIANTPVTEGYSDGTLYVNNGNGTFNVISVSNTANPANQTTTQTTTSYTMRVSENNGTFEAVGEEAATTVRTEVSVPYYGTGKGPLATGGYPLTQDVYTFCADSTPANMSIVVNLFDISASGEDSTHFANYIYGGGNMGIVGDRNIAGFFENTTDNTVDSYFRVKTTAQKNHAFGDGGNNKDYFVAGRRGDKDHATTQHKWSANYDTTHFAAKEDFNTSNGIRSQYGSIVVNLHGGTYDGRVFCGARGDANSNKRFFGRPYLTSNTNANAERANKLQLVYGLKVLNMDGGHVKFSVHGGSEFIDDGYFWECQGPYFTSEDAGNALRDTLLTTLRPSSVVNIVGGIVEKSVYGGGFEGTCYGSIYVNVGDNAWRNSRVWKSENGQRRFGNAWSGYCNNTVDIDNWSPAAPNQPHSNTLSLGKDLYLRNSIYGGSDWGDAGGRSTFNTPGIYGGITDIRIDGQGYETHNLGNIDIPQMNIAMNIMGSGTSTEGGDVCRTITFRNYGYHNCIATSRTLHSIQRADTVILDSVYLTFSGEMDHYYAYPSSNSSLVRIHNLIYHNDNYTLLNAPAIYIDTLISEDDNHTLYSASSNTDDPAYANGAACEDPCTLLNGDGSRNIIGLGTGTYISVRGFDETTGKAKSYYGPVLGYSYLFSSDGTQDYVYARHKTAPSSTETINNGFWNLCSSMDSLFLEQNPEMAYTNASDGAFRYWNIGKTLGSRNRKVVIVADANPYNFYPQNFFLVDSLTDGTNDATGSTAYYPDLSVPTNGLWIDTTNDANVPYNHFAVATATVEMPPSHMGNYYKITNLSIDAENNGEMSLIETAWKPKSHTYPTYSETEDGGQSYTTRGDGEWLSNGTATRGKDIAEDPDFTFGLLFSTDANDFNDEYNLVVAGTSNFSEMTSGLQLPGIKNNDNIPKLNFYLTYNTNFSRTLQRDVVLEMMEYDANGNEVGPIVLTATIATAVTRFKDMTFSALAMYNEGNSDVYTRKTILPATYEERQIFLRQIIYHAGDSNSIHDLDGESHPTNYCYENATTADLHFSLCSTNDRVITERDGQPLLAMEKNSQFAVTITPSEDLTDGSHSTNGWYSIAHEGMDYDAVSLERSGQYKVSSYHESTNAAGDSVGLVKMIDLTKNSNGETTGNGEPIGILDGRAVAAFDLNLYFNGDLMYEECQQLGYVEFRFGYISKSNPDAATNPFSIGVQIKSRQSGDTIYLASADSITRDGITIHAYKSRNANHLQYQFDTLSGNYAGKGYRLLNSGPGKEPCLYLQSFHDIFEKNTVKKGTVYNEGDVICILDTLFVEHNKSFTLRGSDYSMIQMVRYSGSHFQLPGKTRAYKNGPMIMVRDTGTLNLYNIWINGSGCTRTKRPIATGISTRPNSYSLDAMTFNPISWDPWNRGEATVGGLTYHLSYDAANQTLYCHELSPRTADTLFAHSPSVWVEGNGKLQLMNNVRLTNSYNINDESVVKTVTRNNLPSQTRTIDTSVSTTPTYSLTLPGRPSIATEYHDNHYVTTKTEYVLGPDSLYLKKTTTTTTTFTRVENGSKTYYCDLFGGGIGLRPSKPNIDAAISSGNRPNQGKPQVVLGHLTHIYDNITVNHGFWRGGKGNSHGGGIYVDNGNLQIGTSTKDCDVHVRRNFYLYKAPWSIAQIDTNGDSSPDPVDVYYRDSANVIVRMYRLAWNLPLVREEMPGYHKDSTGMGDNKVYSIKDGSGQIIWQSDRDGYHFNAVNQFTRLSGGNDIHSGSLLTREFLVNFALKDTLFNNVFLTRTPHSNYPIGTAESEMHDGQSDLLTFVVQLGKKTRVGISKWFPGGAPSYLVDGKYVQIRDTIAFGKSLASAYEAALAYTNGNFFADSTVFCHKLTPVGAYSIDTLYHNKIAPSTLFLHRCATFQRGRLEGNTLSGDLDYRWLPISQCPTNSDSMMYYVHGGFSPYQYTWSQKKYWHKTYNQKPPVIPVVGSHVIVAANGGTDTNATTTSYSNRNGNTVYTTVKEWHTPNTESSGSLSNTLRTERLTSIMEVSNDRNTIILHNKNGTYTTYTTTFHDDTIVADPQGVRVASLPKRASSHDTVTFDLDGYTFATSNSPTLESGCTTYSNFTASYNAPFGLRTLRICTLPDSVVTATLSDGNTIEYQRVVAGNNLVSYTAVYSIAFPEITFSNGLYTYMPTGQTTAERVEYAGGNVAYTFIPTDGSQLEVVSVVTNPDGLTMRVTYENGVAKTYSRKTLASDAIVSEYRNVPSTTKLYETFNPSPTDSYTTSLMREKYSPTKASAYYAGADTLIVSNTISMPNTTDTSIYFYNVTVNDVSGTCPISRDIAVKHVQIADNGHVPNGVAVGDDKRDDEDPDLGIIKYVDSHHGDFLGHHDEGRAVSWATSEKYGAVDTANMDNTKETAKILRLYEGFNLQAFVNPSLAYGNLYVDGYTYDPLLQGSVVRCPGAHISLSTSPVVRDHSKMEAATTFIQWSADANTSCNLIYGMPEYKAQVTAYYAPTNYWKDWVTVFPEAGHNHENKQLYWTNDDPSTLTTENREGYTEWTQQHYVTDYHGNVYIYDSLGLAWLISTVNGYNGQQAHSFVFDTIFLLTGSQNNSNVIDMSAHKWSPLGSVEHPFKGTILSLDSTGNSWAQWNAYNTLSMRTEVGTRAADSSNEVVIKGIIADQTWLPYVGFFGNIESAHISHFTLRDGFFSGGLVGGYLAGRMGDGNSLKNIHLYNIGGSASYSVSAGIGLVDGTGNAMEGCTFGKESDEGDDKMYFFNFTMYSGGFTGLVNPGANISVTNSTGRIGSTPHGLYVASQFNSNGFSSKNVTADDERKAWTALTGLEPPIEYGDETLGALLQNTPTRNARQAKRTMPSRYENNYVWMRSNEASINVGGIAGVANNAIMRNNYVHGDLLAKTTPAGLVANMGNNVTIDHCYYVQGTAAKKGIASYDGGNNNVNDTSTFLGRGKQVVMTERINGISNLTTSLNNFVRLHNDTGSVSYRTWRSDIRGYNDGHPLFGTPDTIPIYNHLSTEGCDQVLLRNGVFSHDTTLTHHVFNPTLLTDSIVTLVITVHHSAATEITDSVEWGSFYRNGHFSLNPDELNALVYGVGPDAVQVLRLVDSLFTVSGCDSVVTLNLVVYGIPLEIQNPDTPPATFDVKVWPNPTLGDIHVEADGLRQVDIFDNTSRHVRSLKANGDSLSFNMQRHASGAYFLRISTKHGIAVRKVIKK
ncbi:MAG: T9SS type A sorting domain-containing protein [Bacteroidales bacterium]|nr:T9SS type A sorting domain-containing protein [Bacteroidales bacterium]